MMFPLKKRSVRLVFILSALLLSAAMLVYSHRLTRDLYAEEVSKMDVWAQAMSSLTTADESTDLNLVLKVINSNHTIPVVVTDASGTVLTQRNLRPEPTGEDSLDILHRVAKDMKLHGEVMRMELSQHGQSSPNYIYIYYKESFLLQRLTIYPYVQLGVVALFFLIAIAALLISKRAEQNRVWVGLSRETAHQLGTPISSLMAWNEVLRETYPDEEMIQEMEKDVKRLELIAERFSKIGSAPELKAQNVDDIVANVADYFDRRTSSRVHISVVLASTPVFAMVNAPLFEWVIENICKNAIDAMQGIGSLTLQVHSFAFVKHGDPYVRITITDTGKGIPRNRFKAVFKPGFTTKKRGWGLGLSLAKRIVEEYHHGSIYVQSSQVNKGTTFAIELRQIRKENRDKV